MDAETELSALRTPNTTRGSVIAEKFVEDGDTRYAPDGEPGIYIGLPGEDVKVIPAGYSDPVTVITRLRQVVAALIDREVQAAIRKCSEALIVCGQTQAAEVLDASLPPLPDGGRSLVSVKHHE